MKRKLIAVLVSNLFVGCTVGYAQETGLKWAGFFHLLTRMGHVSGLSRSATVPSQCYLRGYPFAVPSTVPKPSLAYPQQLPGSPA